MSIQDLSIRLGKTIGKWVGLGVAYGLVPDAVVSRSARLFAWRVQKLMAVRDRRAVPRLCGTCGSFDPEGAAEVFSRFPAFMQAAQWIEPEGMLGRDHMDEQTAEPKRRLTKWSDAGVCAQHTQVCFAGGTCDQWIPDDAP